MLADLESLALPVPAGIPFPTFLSISSQSLFDLRPHRTLKVETRDWLAIADSDMELTPDQSYYSSTHVPFSKKM